MVQSATKKTLLMTRFNNTNLPGLYIHIPFCQKKCPYCSFYSTTALERIDDFVTTLLTEMKLYQSSWRRFDTFYIGGGTPSQLSIKHFHKILTQIHQTFHITEEAEITVEINPADMNRHDLQALHQMGVNRISIGVQSFNDDILAFLGRRHCHTQARDAIENARQAGFENISLDLIYGIPGQDMSSWIKTLEEALSFEAEHLSCYQLTLGADTPLGKRHKGGEFTLPDDEEQYNFFMTTSTTLEKAGYIHYEVSNFTRKSDLISKHNSKYWNHTPYLGLGPAAHSFLENRRWWNQGALSGYLEDLQAGRAPVASSETLEKEALRLEALFLGFRTKEGIHLEHFNARFECDLLLEKAGILKILEEKGFIRIEEGYLRPTRAGLAVADSLSLI
jgi:oxygen-independent coproporphyrinogen III oxidase